MTCHCNSSNSWIMVGPKAYLCSLLCCILFSTVDLWYAYHSSVWDLVTAYLVYVLLEYLIKNLSSGLRLSKFPYLWHAVVLLCLPSLFTRLLAFIIFWSWCFADLTVDEPLNSKCFFDLTSQLIMDNDMVQWYHLSMANNRSFCLQKHLSVDHRYPFILPAVSVCYSSKFVCVCVCVHVCVVCITCMWATSTLIVEVVAPMRRVVETPCWTVAELGGIFCAQ